MGDHRVEVDEKDGALAVEPGADGELRGVDGRGHAAQRGDRHAGDAHHLIDGEAAIIGSANFNRRSAWQDDEVCLVVRDPALLSTLEAHWREDLARCAPIELRRALPHVVFCGGERVAQSGVLRPQRVELVRRLLQPFVPRREFCTERGLLYQGFSLLTANREALVDRGVHAIAARHGRTVPQVIFRFAIQVGMVALTGTTSPAHLREDLAVYDFELTADEMRFIEEIEA